MDWKFTFSVWLDVFVIDISYMRMPGEICPPNLGE